MSILRRQQPAVQSLISNTATVFDALTARDGQLRSLIENSDQVFRTTSRRAAELQQAFQILPTFQREARATLADLDAFARNTDPLVNQLRPAARELSPTLMDLHATAPDLKALFQDTDRLITASKTGFPAASKLLDDTKPLLREFHPFAGELLPILRFIQSYKRELTAFFANVVAATQATTQVGDKRVHYLRTTNPQNPEILAAYPRRIGSNRPLSYALPGIFDKLGTADFPVFENCQCGRGVPVVSQFADPLLKALAAPPCNLQGKFTFQGPAHRSPPGRLTRRHLRISPCHRVVFADASVD